MTKILIVDDDALFAHMLADRLQREIGKEGVVIEETTSAEAARQKVQEATEPYDILLVDNRLGSGPSGIELIEELRVQNAALDFVLFTGLDEHEVGLRAYRAGAYRYLAKPFQPDELIWIVRSLIDRRAVNYERDWLRILNEIVEELQRTDTVKAVADILVAGGLRLGFDRARFYAVDEVNGSPTLFGLSQAGENQVIGFETIVRRMEDTVYSKVAYEQRAPVFFDNRELGPSFLSAYQTQNGWPEALGRWASIPLFSGEECIGILNLDNSEQQRTVPPQRKELLQLFAGHAVAALERAISHERAKQESEIDRMVQRIVQQMGDPAQPGSLERLLHAIRDELAAHAPIPNFLVVLNSRDTDGYYTRLHIENNEEVRKPYWRSNSEQGMIWCLLTHRHDLFLPQGTEAHRSQYNLRQVGKRAARSWMGVLLRIGDQITGALIAEDDDQEYIFKVNHFGLLQTLADRLAGVIQTAWLQEQEQEYSNLLRRLQQASELIAGFDEEKLWLTTLTLCTADYGASFDRAMLFVMEEGGARLRGYMAIGHLTWDQAKSDWEKDVRIGMNWEKFLDALKVGVLDPTPLHRQVRDYSFAVSDDAFAKVLREKEVVTLSRGQASDHLPADFLARFGLTAYCLVPVKAADQLIGVVVLDNMWETNPQRTGVLNILDNLTNQAALLYENLRKTRAQEQLIAVQHEVLVQAGVRPLQETLLSVCESVQSIAGADLVAIYPLQDNEHELLYDHAQSVQVGRRKLLDHPIKHSPTRLSRHALLEVKRPVFIEDVTTDQTRFNGERHGDASVVKDEGIKATIATPVFGLRTGRPRAMLYIDYHTPRRFTESDRQIAEAFAHLIATAIANWRDIQGFRDTQEAREEELRKLSQVLKGALEAARAKDLVKAEEKVVEILLHAVPSLFAPLPVTAGITLKKWQHIATNAEPVELHHFIYPVESGMEERFIKASENPGINGRAMRSGVLQIVPDISTDKDYVPRGKGDEDTRAEMDVPILVDGQVVGALNIESPRLDAFTTHQEEMGQRFADAAALAIGNVRRQRNLETVLKAAIAVTQPTKLDETLDIIMAEVRDAVPNLSTLIIWYLDPETRTLRLGSYFGIGDVEHMVAEPPREDGAVQMGLKLTRPKWFTDVSRSSVLRRGTFVSIEKIRSTAIFPLRAQGNAIGVMFFSYRERHEFTDEERRLYPILAEVVASSIHDSLQLYRTQQEQKRLITLQRVTEVVSKCTAVEEIMAGVEIALKDMYPHSRLHYFPYDGRSAELALPPGKSQLSMENPPDCFPLRLADNFLQTPKKQVALCKHTSECGVAPFSDSTKTSLGATLVANAERENGEPSLLGILVLESTKADAFDETDKKMIENIARQVRIGLERLEQEKNARFQGTVIGHTAWATPIIHDINRYTGRILHRIERLQRDDALSKDSRKTVDEILQQTEEMKERVSAVDLRREAETAIEIDALLPKWVKNTVAERSVPIAVDLDLKAQGVRVTVLPKALRQVIYDLVRNGMEAMGFEQPDQRIVIRTCCSPDSRFLDIGVWNSGPPIPPSVQSKLFNELYTSKGEERGIELLFARSAVERMKGQVWLVSSSEQGGTEFVLRLRVADALGNEKGIGNVES